MTSQEFEKEYPFITYDQYMCDIPQGWRKSFGEQFLNELKQAILDDGLFNKTRILQIKEKYGELRTYLSYSGEKTSRVVSDYEMISGNVCFVCGKPDVPMLDPGWMCPECKECFDKRTGGRDCYEKFIVSESKIEDTYITKRWTQEGTEEHEYSIKEKADKIRERWAKMEAR